MILIDTNLWLYATLQESPQHSRAKAWLYSCFNGPIPIAMPWNVLRLLLEEAGTAGNSPWMRTWPHWPSSTTAPITQRITISAAFTGCVSTTHSPDGAAHMPVMQ